MSPDFTKYSLGIKIADLEIQLLGGEQMCEYSSLQIATLLSKVVTSFYISTWFQFLHILSHTYYYLSFDDSHSSGYEVVFHCGFEFHFSDD